MITEADRARDYLERIVVNPRILVGKPVIKNTRIPVTLICNLVGHGMTFAEIIEDYPNLTEDDIRAAILYAGARLEHENEFPLAAQS